MVLLAVGLAGMYKLGQKPRVEAKLELQKMAAIQQAPPAVNVVRPVMAAGRSELELPGQTQAWYETTIFARVNGYLESWLVDIGDSVKKDQLLATIRTPELDQQLAEAKAKLGALQADVQLAEAQLNFAKITAERWRAAAPNGAVSQEEKDEKDAEYKTAQAKYAATQAQLELGKATVGKLEAELAFKRVVAPFDGVITRREVDKGSLITAGSTSNNTPLFAIGQADRIRAFVKVPQTAVPDVQVGMAAQVTTQEFPGRVFAGKVSRTARAVDPVSRTLKVEVDVPNKDLVLLPGMYVQVGFQISRTQPPLVIEAGALQMRPEGPMVAVVGPHNHVHFRKITIHHDLGDSIEVAEGLRPEDWVALNISDEISDGEQVRPVRLESSPETAPAPAPNRTLVQSAKAGHNVGAVVQKALLPPTASN